MSTYKLITYLDAEIHEVFDFHIDLDNLLLITPPDFKLQIFHRPEALEVGAKIGLFVKMGPVTTTMESVIEELDRPTRLVDRQIGGFFSKWIHTHEFEIITSKKTKLIDLVEYGLPMGALGKLFGGSYAQNTIEKMFRHRALMTKKLLEKK
jgi:ligand-binding SRPBCC domain-containing protein